MWNWKKSKLTPLAGLFILALAVCAISSYELNRWPGIYINLLPSTDMEGYLYKAHGFWQGYWPPPEPHYQAPLYTYFLALLLVACKSLLQLFLAQGVCYAISITLMVATVGIELGTTAAFIAGLLLIGYGGALYSVNIVHSTVLELLLASILVFSVAIWRRNLRHDTAWLAQVKAVFRWSWLKRWITSTILWSLITGGTFALLCLVRPNFLLLVPFFLAGFWYDRQNYQIPIKPMLNQLAVMTAIAAIIIGVVVIRNNRYSKEFVLLSTNGAETYRIANSRDSVVFNFIYPNKPLMKPDQAVFWRHQWKKALGYWWSCEVPQNDNYYLFREQSLILKFLRLPFAVLGALTIVGSLLLWRQFKQFWPYYCFFWVYYASIVAFFIIGRFRLPGLPAMIVLGVGGVMVIIRLWREKHGDLALFGVGMAVLLLLLMKPQASQIRPQDYRNAIVCSMMFNQPEWAEHYLRKLYRESHDPNDAVPLALSLLLQQKKEPALDIIDELTKQYGGDIPLIKDEIIRLINSGKHYSFDQQPQPDTPDAPPRPLLQLLHYYQEQNDQQRQKLWRVFRS